MWSLNNPLPALHFHSYYLLRDFWQLFFAIVFSDDPLNCQIFFFHVAIGLYLSPFQESILYSIGSNSNSGSLLVETDLP
jgi:hypothetical protein